MMMKKNLTTLLLGALALLASSAAGAYELKDDLGRSSQWAAPPRRIVSMVPSLTESVC